MLSPESSSKSLSRYGFQGFQGSEVVGFKVATDPKFLNFWP